MLQVRVDLADEAVWGATQTASKLSFWNPILVNPSWITANFTRRELGPRDQRVTRLLSEAQVDVILIVGGILEVLVL